MKLKKVKLALLGLVVAGLSSTVVAHNPASTAYVDAKIAELAARTAPLTEADWEAACPGVQDFELCYPLKNKSLAVSSAVKRIENITQFLGAVKLELCDVEPDSYVYIRIGTPVAFPGAEFGPTVMYTDNKSITTAVYDLTGKSVMAVGFDEPTDNNRYIFTNNGPFNKTRYNTGRIPGDRDAFWVQGQTELKPAVKYWAVVIARQFESYKPATLENFKYEWVANP